MAQNNKRKGELINMDNNRKLTVAGTDIDEVKRKNANSGLSYNEVKALLAQTGGYDTAKFSDTNPEEIKRQIQQDISE
jgi:hypothetical protein